MHRMLLRTFSLPPSIYQDCITSNIWFTDNCVKNRAPRRDSSNQAQHVGRGGGGNVFKPSKEDLEHSKKNGDSAIADDVEHAPNNGHAHKKSLAGRAIEFLSGKK